MKIIFSRKGFDSTAGGFPSPIFPDGRLFSIPIPSSKDNCVYKDLDFHYKNDSIQSILNDLTQRNIHSKKWSECDYTTDTQCCHYDPMPFSDHEFSGIALGQVNSAESHLRKQGVDEGDIFLFYGWFKRVHKINGRWIYDIHQPDIHLIWSYMQINERIFLDSQDDQHIALNKYPFLAQHPHIGEQRGLKNSIYLSRKSSIFNYQDTRCLTDTKNYKGRATWRMPAVMNQPKAFSYLNDFSLDNDETIISYRGYGQEFVLDLDKVQSHEDKNLILTYIHSLIL